MNAQAPHPREAEILALLDDELPPETVVEIRRHCASCAPCARLLEELTAVRAMLAAHAPAEPLRPVWPAVHDRLHRPARPLLRPAFAFATTAALAAGIVLGIFAGSAGRRSAGPAGTYLWSVIGSSVTGDGGGAFSEIYPGATIDEGGK